MVALGKLIVIMEIKINFNNFHKNVYLLAFKSYWEKNFNWFGATNGVSMVSSHPVYL